MCSLARQSISRWLSNPSYALPCWSHQSSPHVLLPAERELLLRYRALPTCFLLQRCDRVPSGTGYSLQSMASHGSTGGKAWQRGCARQSVSYTCFF